MTLVKPVLGHFEKYVVADTMTKSRETRAPQLRTLSEDAVYVEARSRSVVKVPIVGIPRADILSFWCVDATVR